MRRHDLRKSADSPFVSTPSRACWRFSVPSPATCIYACLPVPVKAAGNAASQALLRLRKRCIKEAVGRCWEI